MVATLIAAGWVGTLPGWLTLGTLLALGVLLRGGQLGPALGYLREANATLTDENRALHKKVVELEAEKVRLTARTDLAPMQTLMLEQARSNEERAQARFERTVTILDLIAERMGADPNGDAAS
jgi:hypothetical protein